MLESKSYSISSIKIELSGYNNTVLVVFFIMGLFITVLFTNTYISLIKILYSDVYASQIENSDFMGCYLKNNDLDCKFRYTSNDKSMVCYTSYDNIGSSSKFEYMLTHKVQVIVDGDSCKPKKYDVYDVVIFILVSSLLIMLVVIIWHSIFIEFKIRIMLQMKLKDVIKFEEIKDDYYKEIEDRISII